MDKTIDISEYITENLKPSELEGVLYNCEFVSENHQMYDSEPNPVMCSPFPGKYIATVCFSNKVADCVHLHPYWKSGDWWYTASKNQASKRWNQLCDISKQVLGEPDEIVKDGNVWIYHKDNLIIEIIGYVDDFIHGGEIQIIFKNNWEYCKQYDHARFPREKLWND